MKVLIPNHFPLQGSGSGIYTLNVASELVRAGHEVLVMAIAVGIVGGMESVVGIIAAAFLLGFSQSFAAMYIGTHSIMIVYLLAIILVLAFKPSGLFGKFKELEERV